MDEEGFPYTIQGKLGQGGMGEVYRAWDPHAQRHVALKRITTTAQPTHLQRFLREGELTARLDHPGIVKVHRAGHHQGAPYIAYELIEGCQSLDHAFRTRDLDERLDLVLQAADALGHAHARGVVHRDVKPENLLVDREGRVKVADFGLATAADLERLTRTGTTLGTPYYMAPELISMKHGDVGPWTDVWALGVILYEALTDTLPFDGQSMIELAAQILTRDPEPPSARTQASLPTTPEAVCLRALMRAPGQRPTDAAAFASALRSDDASPAPRSRWRWIGAGALALAAAVAWRHGQSGPQPPRRSPLPSTEQDPLPRDTAEPLAADPTSVEGFRLLRRWVLDPTNAAHPQRPQTLQALRRAARAPLLRLRCDGPPAHARWLTQLVPWGNNEVLAYGQDRNDAWWLDLQQGTATPMWRDNGLLIQDACVVVPRRLSHEAADLEGARDPQGPLSVADDDGERVWRVRGTDPITAFDAHPTVGWAVARKAGEVWVSEGGTPSPIAWEGQLAHALRFSHDGRTLLIAGGAPVEGARGSFDFPLTCWSLADGVARWTAQGTGLWQHVEPLADGTWLGSDANGGVVRLRAGAEERFQDPSIGGDDLLRLARAHGTATQSARAHDGFAFTISGHFQGGDSSWALWNLEERTLLRRHDLAKPGTSLALTPDGALVILGLESGRIEVWGNPAGLDAP